MMINIYDHICATTSYNDQLMFGKTGEIFIDYHCSITEQKTRVWSHKNFLMYVVEGSTRYEVPDAYHESSEQELLFIRKGGFALHKKFEKPYHALMFVFDDAFIKGLVAEYPTLLEKKVKEKGDFLKQPGVMELQSTPLIRSIFLAANEYLKLPANESKISIELKFKELLVNLLREKVSNPFHLYLSWLCNDEAVSFVKLMRDNSSFNFTTKELARTAGMSEPTFKRVFQKHIGVPPGKWLQEQRMARALLLLSNPKNTISEIAFQLGYSDAAAFSKAFRKATRLNPSDYYKQQPDLK
ncbi:MAG: helix-turn-helix domain-containing protein [Terrimonas sp.]|nr:helix-turn-helix domain-containing protein [Terrimonas sp.]